MDFETFRAKYENVILGPLSFPLPPVDVDKLIEWANNNTDCEYNVHVDTGGKLSREEFEEKMNVELAFFNSYFLLYGMPGEKSKWYKDFDKQFPEFVEWLDLLPLEGEKQFGFLMQRDPSQIAQCNPSKVSHIHTDEHDGFGMRMYLNAPKNRMLFYGLKEGSIGEYIKNNPAMSNIDLYHKDGKAIIENGVPLANDAFFKTPVKTKLKDPNTIFLVNNVKAAHFVQHEDDGGQKLTFLMMGRRQLKDRYDWAKLDVAFQQAMKERPDEFLYYDDLRN